MRAPGTAPGTCALESAFDEAAEQLGIDPVELRVRNFADHDQEAGRPWSSNGLLECYSVGAERFGWSQRPAPGAATRDETWRIGWGMASTLYPAIRQACRVRVEVGCGRFVVRSMRHTGHGLGHLHGARPDGGVRPRRFPCARSRSNSAIRCCRRVRFRWVPGDREPRARNRTGHDRTPRDAGEHGRVTDERFAALAANGSRNVEFRGRNDPKPDRRCRRVADGCAGARSGAEGLEAEGESAATQHGSSLATSSMGYGAVFVEVGVDAQLGEIRVRRVMWRLCRGSHHQSVAGGEASMSAGLIGGNRHGAARENGDGPRVWPHCRRQLSPTI